MNFKKPGAPDAPKSHATDEDPLPGFKAVIPVLKDEARVKEFFGSSTNNYDFTKKPLKSDCEIDTGEDLRRLAQKVFDLFFQKGDTVKARNTSNQMQNILMDKLNANRPKKKPKYNSDQNDEENYLGNVTSTGMYLNDGETGLPREKTADELETEEIENTFLGYAKLDKADRAKLEEQKKLTREAKGQKGLTADSEKFLKGTKFMVDKDELADMEYDEFGVDRTKVKFLFGVTPIGQEEIES